MCLLILKNNPIRFTSPLALSASSNFSSLLKIPIFSSPSSLLNSALSSSLRKWKQQVPTITSAHLVTLMLLIFPFPPTVVAEGTAILSEPWQNSRTLRIPGYGGRPDFIEGFEKADINTLATKSGQSTQLSRLLRFPGC